MDSPSPSSSRSSSPELSRPAPLQGRGREPSPEPLAAPLGPSRSLLGKRYEGLAFADLLAVIRALPPVEHAKALRDLFRRPSLAFREAQALIAELAGLRPWVSRVVFRGLARFLNATSAASSVLERLRAAGLPLSSDLGLCFIAALDAPGFARLAAPPLAHVLASLPWGRTASGGLLFSLLRFPAGFRLALEGGAPPGARRPVRGGGDEGLLPPVARACASIVERPLAARDRAALRHLLGRFAPEPDRFAPGPGDRAAALAALDAAVPFPGADVTPALLASWLLP